MNSFRSRRYARLASMAIIAAAVAGACTTSGAASLSAMPTASPTASPTPMASVSAAPTSAASPAGQTETDWGRIWDALPSSFPTIAGSEPTQTGGGAASAVLDVPGTPADVAQSIRTSLESAGFTTEAMNSQENGGVVIDSTGSGDCQSRRAWMRWARAPRSRSITARAVPSPEQRGGQRMHPRVRDFVEPAILVGALTALILLLVLGNLPH